MTKAELIHSWLRSFTGRCLVEVCNYCFREIKHNSDSVLYNFDELCEVVEHYTPRDLMMSMFCGYHADSKGEWYGSFNHNAEYYYFNEHANLCSIWSVHAYQYAKGIIEDSVNDDTEERHLDEILKIVGLYDMAVRMCEEDDSED